MNITHRLGYLIIIGILSTTSLFAQRTADFHRLSLENGIAAQKGWIISNQSSLGIDEIGTVTGSFPNTNAMLTIASGTKGIGLLIDGGSLFGVDVTNTANSIRTSGANIFGDGAGVDNTTLNIGTGSFIINTLPSPPIPAPYENVTYMDGSNVMNMTPIGVNIITGTGTLNTIPMWTPNGFQLGNSIITETPTTGITITPTIGTTNNVFVVNGILDATILSTTADPVWDFRMIGDQFVAGVVKIGDGIWLDGTSATHSIVTDAPTNVGTKNFNTFSIIVNNTRAMMYIPTALGPNILGGDVTNSIVAGGYSNIIAGGGAAGFPNLMTNAAGAYNTISGGGANVISGAGYTGTIGGGGYNQVTAYRATVAGGAGNTASGQGAFVGGGESGDALGANNTASGAQSVIGGGQNNTAAGTLSTIPGGRGLTLDASATSSFGFLGANAAGANNMTISTPNTAVFGNTNMWLANNTNTASQLRFYEANATASGAFPPALINYTAFRAGVQLSDVTYTLPVDGGTAGQVLTTSGGGTSTLSWTTPAAVIPFADFYALMPADNAATVAVGAAVAFPQNGPTSGSITRLNATQFNLPNIGTYEVFFQVSVDEAAQLMLRVNAVELAYSVVGRATGTNQLTGMCMVTTVAVNTTLEVVNPSGNATALTITPLAGGTHPVSAHLVIKQIQ